MFKTLSFIFVVCRQKSGNKLCQLWNKYNYTLAKKWKRRSRLQCLWTLLQTPQRKWDHILYFYVPILSSRSFMVFIKQPLSSNCMVINNNWLRNQWCYCTNAFQYAYANTQFHTMNLLGERLSIAEWKDMVVRCCSIFSDSCCWVVSFILFLFW